ncbi:MAG: hypothetical protein GDA50_07080 [Alphaproteobacteria bacterium GM202ARS2]|nr:hypothetical protein [Alphaproteobacteria bacterium GM202ARS2]
MDAEFGTPEGERLDALVTQVEAYEAKYHNLDVLRQMVARSESRRTTSWFGALRRMVAQLMTRSVRVSK